MIMLTVIFGLLSGSLLSILVGILGSRRKIGFGWSFLLSVLFTPLIGLICALISDPLSDHESSRWGCIGTILAILGLLCLATFLWLLIAGSAALLLA